MAALSVKYLCCATSTVSRISTATPRFATDSAVRRSARPGKPGQTRIHPRPCGLPVSHFSSHVVQSFAVRLQRFRRRPALGSMLLNSCSGCYQSSIRNICSAANLHLVLLPICQPGSRPPQPSKLSCSALSLCKTHLPCCDLEQSLYVLADNYIEHSIHNISRRLFLSGFGSTLLLRRRLARRCVFLGLERRARGLIGV